VEHTTLNEKIAEVGIQNIKTQTKVTAIKEVDNHLEVTGSDGPLIKPLQLSALYLRIC
jgi:monoamine oxidase